MKQTARHTRLYFIFSFLLSIFLVETPISSFAQSTFQRTVGLDKYEGAYSVLPIADGYLIAGVTNSVGAGGQDILILKIDLNFNSVWAKTFGGDKRDYPRSIIACSDGGYLILGSTESFGQGNKDILAIKLGSDYALEWTKTYGRIYSDDGFYVIEATDGYMIGGDTQSGNGALVLKIDDSGDVVWGRTYGYDENSTKFYNILRLSNGNYIFDCPFQSSGSGYNFMLAEITPSGDLVMAKSYNAPDVDQTSDILKIDGDGYYILGH